MKPKHIEQYRKFLEIERLNPRLGKIRYFATGVYGFWITGLAVLILVTISIMLIDLMSETVKYFERSKQAIKDFFNIFGIKSNPGGI